MSNQITDQPPTLDSREVAEMIGKRHDHLIRDIKGYLEIISLTPKLGAADFFIESVYKDASGKMNKCYLLIKMGCEMVANKLTGRKGVLFTAAYVKKFNEMEKGNRQTKQSTIPDAIRSKEADAKLMNARARVARQYHKMLDEFGGDLNVKARQQLIALEANTLSGKPWLIEPRVEPKAYSAEDLGKPIGWSAYKVGKFTTANNLKRDGIDGEYRMSKSKYSEKQVTTFVYNEAGRQRFYKAIGRTDVLGDA